MYMGYISTSITLYMNKLFSINYYTCTVPHLPGAPFLLQTRNTVAIKVEMTARTMTNARAPTTPPTIGLTEAGSAHVFMLSSTREKKAMT